MNRSKTFHTKNIVLFQPTEKAFLAEDRTALHRAHNKRIKVIMGMIMMAAVCMVIRGGYAHRRYGFLWRHQYRVEHPEPLHHFQCRPF